MATLAKAPNKPWAELTLLEKVIYLAENLDYKMFPVFGVEDGACMCGNAHVENSGQIGKHPAVSKWEEVATSDVTVLTAMFKGRENFNYGIYMRGSGLMAIDIDVKAGGWNSWDRLEDACQYDFLPTVEVETGFSTFAGERSRGAHKYYRSIEDFKFAGNLTKAGFPSIDLRHNALVIGPGSTHVSGVLYEWKPGHAPWEIEVAELPVYSLGYLGSKQRAGRIYAPKSSLGDDEWQKAWEAKIVAEFEPTPYAKTALKNTYEELAKMKPGSGRNNALNAKAFAMGRLIGGGQLSFPEAHKTLKMAIEKSYGVELPHKIAAIETTLRAWGGGFECGALEPRFPNELSESTLVWLQEHIAKPIGSDIEVLDDVISLANQGFFGRSGELRRETLEQAVRCLGPIATGPGQTLWSYSDGLWKPNGREQVIYRTGRFLGEAARPAHSQTLTHFMEVEPQFIDGLGPKEYLNLKNGMLDWKTGDLLMHDPYFKSTVQLPLNWNPDAKCPTVDKFFEQVLHTDLISLMWEIIGICVFTGMGFQKAIFFDGIGRNGKGTILRLIEALIPIAFVANVELQELMKDKFAKAQLYGKIVSIVGDLSSKALEDPSIFKQLTGQDRVTAEFKYGQPFSFTSQATMLFAANKLPESFDTSKGFFSRLLIVPFDKLSLDESQVDDTLEDRMHLELEGVLVKAVAGLKRAMERGGFEPVARCEAALMSYKGDRSQIFEWWATQVIVTGDNKDRVERGNLYASFYAFASSLGVEPMSKVVFYSRLRSEFTKWTTEVKSGEYFFTNIRLG